MSIPSISTIPDNLTHEETVNEINKRLKEIDWLLNGMIDSKNTREIGGWRVSQNQLVSKDGDVGMSTADTESDDIRFWAGDAIDGSPSFYVTKSGKMYALDGTFVGTITATAGTIGGWTISPTKLSGSGIIEGGTINGSEINGAEINGGTIDVETDVHIGEKLYLNPTSFTSDIVFNAHVRMYGEPAAQVLRIIAPNGLFINGTSLASMISNLQSQIDILDDRVTELEIIVEDHEERIEDLEGP